MIERNLSDNLIKKFHKGKALILVGPRQVGKTTLIKKLLQNRKYLFLNGDDPRTVEFISKADTSTLRKIIGTNTLVFIDEAQRIPDIGVKLKLITDQIKKVQLIVSSSSALDLNAKTQEPLTGRKFEYQLYPISWSEYENYVGYLEADQQLEHRLVYGMYPDVITSKTDEREVLDQLTTSYLYKDVLGLAGIRKPELLDRLLKALALQLGSEVSYTELSGLLGVDKSTVMRYIELLEKTFIVFQLNSFSRNQRNEIKNNRKIYFYDNGIRNSIIRNLNPLELRTDKGALWENFLISERIKRNAYGLHFQHHYFWRTVQKQEIDYVEDSGGKISAFEFKWKSGGRKRIPRSFIEKYEASATVVMRENFREFIE